MQNVAYRAGEVLGMARRFAKTGKAIAADCAHVPSRKLVRELHKFGEDGLANRYGNLRASGIADIMLSLKSRRHYDISSQRFDTSHKIIQDAIPEFMDFCNSLPVEYDAKTTIYNMMMEEQTKTLEAERIRDAEINRIGEELEQGIINKTAHRRQRIAANAQCRKAVQEAKTNWRQTEWLGWNFENLVLALTQYKHLGGRGEAFGRTVLDTMVGPEGNKIPMDVKFHSMQKPDGKPNVVIPLNGQEAIDACLEKYGTCYIFVAKGDVEYDVDGSVRAYQHELQGGMSDSSRNNREQGKTSRVLKKSAKVVEYAIYAITNENKHMLTDFRQGGQDTGASRNVKYSLNFGKGGFVPLVKFVTPYGKEQGR